MWQLLQRGFATRTGNGYRTTVYTRNREPFFTNTVNFGSQRDFYANQGDFTADERITDFENQATAVVLKLRSGDSLSSLDANALAELIAHLEFRTLFLRRELVRLGGWLRQTLLEWFGDKKRFASLMQDYLLANPDIIQEAIRKNLGDDVNADALPEFFMSRLVEEIPKVAREMSATASMAIASLSEQLEHVGKEAHLKALREDIAPEKRAENYSGLHFSVLRFGAGDLILPDTMVIFSDGKRLSPFHPKEGAPAELFLPIDSSSILIGHKGQLISRDIRQLNRMLSSGAFKSFIARDDVHSLRRLSPRIGKHAKILTERELSDIARSALEKLVRRQQGKVGDPPTTS